MYRKTAVSLALMLCLLNSAYAAPDTSARSAILIEAETGRVIYAENPDEPMLIASTTKILTALIVLERCDTAASVVIPPEAAGIEGSSMYLKAGETFTVHELLCGLMLRSGNDAAAALAVHACGSTEAFAEVMNQKALALGMTRSYFENPHGLWDKNISTASDMAKLTAAAMKNPDFAAYSSMKYAKAGLNDMKNHNRLLWTLEGCDGVKTGYTKKAGRALVSSATRDGARFIAVTLNDPNDWRDHTALLEYAFSRYKTRVLVEPDKAFPVTVLGGTVPFCHLVSKEGLRLTLSEEEFARVTLEIDKPPYLWAEVPGGKAYGTIRAVLDGKVLAETALVTETAVEAVPEVKGWIRSLKERLQKLIAARGIASRRAAEQWIIDGRVTVDGAAAVLGDTADPETQAVLIDGVPLPDKPSPVYIALYKPRGVVTTRSDEQNRKTVTDLMPPELKSLVPVGRLDLSSEGLLLMTNDGGAVYALTHPSYEVEKTYLAWVRGDTKAAAELLGRPMTLEGVTLRPARAYERSPGVLQISVREGKNRQVRRMCEAAGLHVTRLKRISEGKIRLGELAAGQYRTLTEEETAYIQAVKSKGAAR